MQQKKLLFLTMLIFVATNSAANTPYPAVFKTTAGLNIRQQPIQTSTKIGILQTNTEVIVDSLYDKQWACITHNGKVAFISTKYIVFHHEIAQEESIIDTIKNSQYTNIICYNWFTIVVSSFLLIALIIYLCLLREQHLFYGGILMFGFLGCYTIGLFIGTYKGCVWAIAIYLIGLFCSCLTHHKVRNFLEYIFFEPIYALNQLQYILHKPWRFLQKNKNNLFCKILKVAPEINPSQHKMQRFCYRLWKIWHYIISAVFFFLQSILYIFCAPLRLINALIYNIIIHIPCALHDYLAEVFNPKGDGMRHLEKWEYAYRYITIFPYRVYKYLLKRGFLTILESLIYTIIDVIIPTLTLYHGTSNNASYEITGNEDIQFKVGGGNYAGNGIYFAISKDTARHYARGVIIVSRVSLGRIFNVNIAPTIIRNYVARNGQELTNWGLQQKIKTFEWWRETGHWWEYCMIQPTGIYKESWRIRPLYIENLNTGLKERVYKGMAHWLFKEKK